MRAAVGSLVSTKSGERPRSRAHPHLARNSACHGTTWWSEASQPRAGVGRRSSLCPCAVPTLVERQESELDAALVREAEHRDSAIEPCRPRASLYDSGHRRAITLSAIALSSTGAGPRGWGRCRRLAVAQCTPTTCTAGCCRCGRPPARRAACGSRSSSPGVVREPVTIASHAQPGLEAPRDELRAASPCARARRRASVLAVGAVGCGELRQIGSTPKTRAMLADERWLSYRGENRLAAFQDRIPTAQIPLLPSQLRKLRPVTRRQGIPRQPIIRLGAPTSEASPKQPHHA